MAAQQPQNGLGGGGGGGGKLQMADKKPARRVGAKPPPDRAQKSMGCLSLKNPLRSDNGIGMNNISSSPHPAQETLYRSGGMETI